MFAAVERLSSREYLKIELRDDHFSLSLRRMCLRSNESRNQILIDAQMQRHEPDDILETRLPNSPYLHIWSGYESSQFLYDLKGKHTFARIDLKDEPILRVNRWTDRFETRTRFTGWL